MSSKFISMVHQDDDDVDEFYEDDIICSQLFLSSSPSYKLHSKPQSQDDFKLWVISSKDEEGSQNNSCSSSDDVRTQMTIPDMAISAFSKVESSMECIVQLWAPVTIDGKLLLSTYRQPFALRHFTNDSENYRRRSEKYGYNIDVNNKSIIDENGQNSLHEILSTGPPLSAFLNCLPQMLILNTSVCHEAGPLLGYGYEECRLTASWMMPIWGPSQSPLSLSDCIGVVECSSLWSLHLSLFNELNEELEKVGLRLFNVHDRIPYKTICGLKHTRDQIQEALETVCELHNIFLAQVWTSYEDDNHEHFSSLLTGTQMKQMIALKLTGYKRIDNEDTSDFSDRLREYYNACDMIPLKVGDELPLKTLQDYQPRFCKDYSKLHTDKLMAWASWGFSIIGDAGDKSSGLVICLRSSNTGNFCYAFTFLWIHNPNYLNFLEELLLTLKKCFPHFKFASGAELGDELHVIDADNSRESETKTFQIFQENRVSPIAKAMRKGNKAMVVDYKAPSKAKRDTRKKQFSQEQIEQQYGKSLIQAAAALGVSESTLKRKRNELNMGEWPEQALLSTKANNYNKKKSRQSRTNKECNEAVQDSVSVNKNENSLIIKAEYTGDTIKFDLPISEATYDIIEKEIGVRFQLRLGTYRLKYRDGGDWISLLSNKDMIYYIETLRGLGQTEARLRVFITSSRSNWLRINSCT